LLIQELEDKSPERIAVLGAAALLGTITTAIFIKNFLREAEDISYRHYQAQYKAYNAIESLERKSSN